MKIKVEHLEHLRTEINKTLAKYPNVAEEYEQGLFPRSDKVKDLQRRFCFDLSYGSGLNKFICEDLYTYMDDTHLYTALKKVCPTVTRRY